MYSFRKPFSVGTFEGKVNFLGLLVMDTKILFIISQVFGYTISKFIGIKLVSEMKAMNRGLAIMGLILFAEFSLLLFAIIPTPYNCLALFLNGLPLGMIWGLCFSYLEGRKSSDLMGPGLSLAYIVGSGVVKSVGKWTLTLGVSEYWMPFLTGLIFLPFIGFSVYMLNLIPPPTLEEQALRTKRQPMNSTERKLFMKTFTPGVISMTGLYMIMTAYRDFRDNFAREIWDALGEEGNSKIFALSELPAALGVLIALGLIVLVKSNKRSFDLIFILMIGGMASIGISTMAYQAGVIGPTTWMVTIGLGLYLGYVPYGCMLFDNLLSMTHFIGTAAFMIYLSDAFGYVGSVGIMLYKTFGQSGLSWLDFFIQFSYITSIVCGGSLVFSYFYFIRHKTLIK